MSSFHSKPKVPKERTLKEIIDDAKTGIPSQTAISNISRRKRAREAKLRGETIVSTLSTSLPATPSELGLANTSNNSSLLPTQQNTNITSTPDATLIPSKDSDKQRLIAPQVQIVDGRIVVNQASLEVSTESKRPVIGTTKDELQVVHEAVPSRITSSSYTKRLVAEKWKPSETATFYQGLQLYGTDFTLISEMFTNRSRKQVKNKFKREEKIHPDKVDDSLSHRLTRDNSSISSNRENDIIDKKN